jgi:hypothetical protein
VPDHATGTAHLIRTVPVEPTPGRVALMSLYAVSPPCAPSGEAYSHLLVLAAADAHGEETLVFGADEHGVPRSLGDLPGSFRGAMDHHRALRRAGYELDPTHGWHPAARNVDRTRQPCRQRRPGHQVDPLQVKLALRDTGVEHRLVEVRGHQITLVDEDGRWRRLFTHDATTAAAALLLLDEPVARLHPHAILVVGGSWLSVAEDVDAWVDCA